MNEFVVTTLSGDVTVHGTVALVNDGVLHINNCYGDAGALFKHWEHVVSTPLVATYRESDGGAA